MEDIRLKDLLKKHKEGICSPSEREELLQWLNTYNEDQTEIEPEVIDRLGQEVRLELFKLKAKSPDFSLWSILSTVATLTLIAFITFFYFKPATAPLKSASVQDILPGTNRATITLANGKIINLSSTKTGVAIHSTGLTYTDGTPILKSATSDAAGLATITTPKGGEYHIILSDGTEVWLNAASTLKYPITFSAFGYRAVELKGGEAYFQVAKDRNRPFVVTSAGQQVLVLGTHFNINTYNIEAIKTTLTEGAVRVSGKDAAKDTRTLVPGQQAVNNGKSIKVNTVDTDIELAWKKGKIQFARADLITVMGMISRWYDVEVSYQYYPADGKFTGSVSRSTSISEVLDLLESTGEASFKIEGRRVLIMK